MRLWIVSLIFYVFVFAVCEVLRLIIARVLPKRLSAELLLEFVGTLQICTPMFDVNTVLDAYGLFGVFVEITVIELANCYFQRDAFANPCPIVSSPLLWKNGLYSRVPFSVTSCYRRSKAVRRAVYLFMTQMLAAYLSFFIARSFWKLGIHPAHLELLAAQHCTADLTTAVTTGCLIEGGATFLGRAFEKYVADYFEDTWICNTVSCAFSGLVCAMGINYTGMYANPLVAWACTFNCEGLTHVGHLLIYWLCPLIGWYLAEVTLMNADENEECSAKKIN